MKTLLAPLLLTCFACQSSAQEEPATPVLDVTADSATATHELSADESAMNFRVYAANEMDLTQEPFTYVPLSDDFQLPYCYHEEECDTSIISQKYFEDSNGELNFHILKQRQRSLFLDSAGIRESDSIFIYNLHNGTVQSYRIQDLKLIAFLSYYHGGNGATSQPGDYMIGLAIYDENRAPGYTNQLACIASECPFNKSSMELVYWEKIDTSIFQATPFTFDFYGTDVKIDSVSTTYHSSYKHLDLYAQDGYSRGQRYDGTVDFHFRVRLLTVYNPKKERLVYTNLFFESEGTSAVDLALKGADYRPNQYIGNLFKGMPPVFYGIQYESFGCEEILILNELNQSIGIRCDNRH